jgi:hypothetical protein
VGADFIVRTGWTRLRLLGADRAPVAWERIFGPLASGDVAERAVEVDYSGKGCRSRGDETFPARLIVLRLSPEASTRAARAQHRKQNRCRSRRPPQPLTVQAMGFLMLLTSLPPGVPAAEVLAAYRLRWQVELAFKRLKSLLGLHRLPVKSEALARSWLFAHLILALQIEEASRALPDFPPLAAGDGPTLHLRRARRARHKTTPATLAGLAGESVRAAMLTGDNRTTVEAVAKWLGIAEVIAGVVSEGKQRVRAKASEGALSNATSGARRSAASAWTVPRRSRPWFIQQHFGVPVLVVDGGWPALAPLLGDAGGIEGGLDRTPPRRLRRVEAGHGASGPRRARTTARRAAR